MLTKESCHGSKTGKEQLTVFEWTAQKNFFID
jgi:hypothetical protein